MMFIYKNPDFHSPGEFAFWIRHNSGAYQFTYLGSIYSLLCFGEPNMGISNECIEITTEEFEEITRFDVTQLEQVIQRIPEGQEYVANGIAPEEIIDQWKRL